MQFYWASHFVDIWAFLIRGPALRDNEILSLRYPVLKSRDSHRNRRSASAARVVAAIRLAFVGDQISPEQRNGSKKAPFSTTMGCTMITVSYLIFGN